MRVLTSTALVMAALAAPAPAQDATVIEVARGDQYGEYLATGEGRPVYLFTADTQGSGSEEPRISCTSEDCLNAWPLVTTQGDPQAGEAVNADMLGTFDHEGQTVVTYNGWPLYHFARDAGGEAPQGQDVESFGGEWYLVTPGGEKVHAE